MPVSKSFAVPAELLAPPSSIDAGRSGRRTIAALSALGGAAVLAWACIRALRHPRAYLPLTFAQVWEIGIGSLPLVLLVAMISGAVTSGQSGYQYSSTLPPWIVGSVITASVITELGPLSTGLVLVGRMGARIGAELGAMSVTEQIQALGSILAKVDSGNGSLGRAVNDPALYEALLTATAHVDQAASSASALVRDVRARPGRYVRVSLF